MMRPETIPGQPATVPNFDRLAHAYRWMEYLSFGPFLERCRFHFLPECFDAQQALVFGDGDGRFTARLLASNPRIQIDAVDVSPAMLQQLRRRATAASTTAPDRLRTTQADLRAFIPFRRGYDLVVSHFFLDCLTESDVSALVERTLPYLTPRATWVVSEFCIPKNRWRATAARAIISSLYFAFFLMTGLQVRQIPNYSAILSRSGFRLRQQTSFVGGLLVAQVWQRTGLS